MAILKEKSCFYLYNRQNKNTKKKSKIKDAVRAIMCGSPITVWAKNTFNQMTNVILFGLRFFVVPFFLDDAALRRTDFLWAWRTRMHSSKDDGLTYKLIFFPLLCPHSISVWYKTFAKVNAVIFNQPIVVLISFYHLPIESFRFCFVFL